MIKEIQTLIAALQTHYLKDEWLWRRFAEKNLIEMPSVPMWLIDLDDAKDTKDALGALWRSLEKIDSNDYFDGTSLELGFLYLRFLKGELNALKLLLLAGELSDNSGYDNPECSAFFVLANEYEKIGFHSTSDIIALRERVDALFSKHSDFAQQSFDDLKKKYF